MNRFLHQVQKAVTPQVPEFLMFRGVGMNLSDHSVKLVKLDRNNHPQQIGKEAVPEGAVVDGQLKDPDAVSTELKELQERFNLKYVRLSIPEENGYIFNIKLPGVKQSELREAISLRLTEQVPISQDNAVFDFDVTHTKSNGVKYVTVSVLPADLVAKYLHMCSEADLVPLSFEIEAQTIRKAVIPEDNDSVTMVMDIGKTRTGIFIVDEQTVKHTHTLQAGGDRMTEAIKEAGNISWDEAEEIKREKGFTRNAESAERFAALSDATSVFVDEANRRFRFWRAHSEEVGHQTGDISQLILVGGNASVPGLDDYIAEHLDISVSVGNVWQNAFDISTHIPDIDFSHSLTYASAIGLALSNEI